MLPYSLGSAATSAISGVVVTRVGHYRPIIFISWAIMTLGFGLMIRLSNTSNQYVVYALCRFPLLMLPFRTEQNRCYIHLSLR